MKKILLCDDDTVLRQTVLQYLNWYDFQAEGIDQSGDIVGRLEQNRYDLLICNAWQTLVGGFELCRAMRKSQESHVKNMPILMVSPEPLDHEDYKFLREHYVFFMTKFQKPEKWLGKINSILSQ